MSKAPPIALVKFLVEDGHTLHETDVPSELSLNCFNPNHRDEGQMMRVNQPQESYRCPGCNATGNALSYLRRFRKLDNERAFALLAENRWTTEQINHADRVDKQTQVAGLQYVHKIPDEIAKRGLRKSAEYHYSNGKVIVQTRAMYTRTLASRRSTRQEYHVFAWATSRGGGYWVCDAIEPALPDDDRVVQQYPLYRWPDMLKRLEDGDHESVWLVHDERTVEMVRGIEDHPKGPIPVTCLYAPERTRIEDHDIAPLKGKSVMLISVQDEPGRRLMRRLGYELGKVGINATFCLMSGNSGATLGDIIGQSGLEGARQWLNRAYVGADPEPPAPAEAPDPIDEGVVKNPHFAILGLVEGKIAVRSKRTHELMYVARTMLTNEAHLIPIAPFPWWLKLAGAKGEELSRGQRARLADKLNRAAEDKGFFDLTNAAIGRGAFTYMLEDKPRIGFNLGNQVLIEGPNGTLSETVGLEAIDEMLLPGAPIDLYDHPKAEDYGKALVDALHGYRWAQLEHAKAFIGWIVTALIGGALRFRPALWMVGSSSVGKTYLMDALKDIMGPLSASFVNVSQAGVANTVRSDSLPCLADEFEPKKGDEDKWQRVLAFMRQSTSGHGQMARGTAEGMVRSTRPRCSLIFASIKVPPLDAAESNRVWLIRFGRPVPDWPAVDDAIIEATTPTKMLALRTHIIRNLPAIQRTARELERRLLRRKAGGMTNTQKTREAQILAALTAGYGFLAGGDYSLIRRTEEVNDDDTYNTLEALLAQRAETEGGASYTIAELLAGSGEHAHLRIAEAKRRGFMLLDDGSLVIAHTFSRTKGLLRGTAHANVDLDIYLRGIGADLWKLESGHPARLNTGSARYYCRRVPKEILDEIGFGGGPDE